MKELSENLKKIGNRNPFLEPENYFEKLPTIIDAKTTPKKVSLFEKTKPLLYFAAMFIGFYVVIHFTITTLNSNEWNLSNALTKSSEKEKNTTSTEDTYYNYIVTEIDENMIVDYLLAEN